MRFTHDNTNGNYSRADLAELNEAFDALFAGCDTSDIETASAMDYVAECMLAGFDAGIHCPDLLRVMASAGAPA